MVVRDPYLGKKGGCCGNEDVDVGFDDDEIEGAKLWLSFWYI